MNKLIIFLVVFSTMFFANTDFFSKWDIFMVSNDKLYQIKGNSKEYVSIFYEDKQVDLIGKLILKKDNFLHYAVIENNTSDERDILLINGEGELQKINKMHKKIDNILDISSNGEMQIGFEYGMPRILYLSTQEEIVTIDKGELFQALFTVDDKFIIYEKDLGIYRYDIETRKKEYLFKLEKYLNFGDISVDNTRILCTNSEDLMVLNIETKKLELIKHFEPHIFQYRTMEGSPIILKGKAKWLPDESGMVYTKYTFEHYIANIFVSFGVEQYAKPDLFWYDLETGKEEYLMSGASKWGFGIRRKVSEEK